MRCLGSAFSQQLSSLLPHSLTDQTPPLLHQMRCGYLVECVIPCFLLSSSGTLVDAETGVGLAFRCCPHPGRARALRLDRRAADARTDAAALCAAQGPRLLKTTRSLVASTSWHRLTLSQKRKKEQLLKPTWCSRSSAALKKWTSLGTLRALHRRRGALQC